MYKYLDWNHYQKCNRIRSHICVSFSLKNNNNSFFISICPVFDSVPCEKKIAMKSKIVFNNAAAPQC